MRLVVLLASLFFTLASHSEEIEKTDASHLLYDSLIKQLISDVENILQIKAPAEIPKVYFASGEKIKELYCNEIEKCNVIAVTNRESGEIIISYGFIPNNAVSVSILFHEIVHWIQVKNKMFQSDTDCVNWSKAEMHAYSAQSIWLQQRGFNGFSVPDLTKQCK